MGDKTKHLVRVGHEFAAAMSDDTPIITIAKMVTELASALDVQTARSDALAAELARYSMPAGEADQRMAESRAVRQALGFGQDADDVAPVDLVERINALAAALKASEANDADARCHVAELEAKCAALAAENAALKATFDKPQAYLSWHAIPPTWDEPLPCGEYLDVHDTDGHKNSDGTDCWPVFAKPEIETPATDAWVNEQRAAARKEGAYFVANRMLAAWDAGFINDTAKNAADIARMILTSTEFMTDAPDGDFNRSFADSLLGEIAAQLRGSQV